MASATMAMRAMMAIAFMLSWSLSSITIVPPHFGQGLLMFLYCRCDLQPQLEQRPRTMVLLMDILIDSQVGGRTKTTLATSIYLVYARCWRTSLTRISNRTQYHTS